jgi:hypothetical protein
MLGVYCRITHNQVPFSANAVRQSIGKLPTYTKQIRLFPMKEKGFFGCDALGCEYDVDGDVGLVVDG